MTECITKPTPIDQTQFDLSPLVPGNYLIEQPEHRGLPLSAEDAAHYKDVLDKVKNPVVTIIDSHRTIENQPAELIFHDQTFNYFSIMHAAIRSARGIPLGIDIRDGQLIDFDPWSLELMDTRQSGRSNALRMIIMGRFALMSESTTPEERPVPETYDSSLARIDAVLAETLTVDPETSFRYGDARHVSDFSNVDPNETFRL